MPIAAIPNYLQTQDLSQASPGLRFGMYLSIWTERVDQEREIKARASRKSREGFEVQQMLAQHGMDATISTLSQREHNKLPGLWDKNDAAARQVWGAITKLTDNDKNTMKALAERQVRLAEQAPALLTLDAIATAPFTTGLGNEHPTENGFAFLNPYGLPYLPGSGIKGVLRQAARELASGDWGDSHGWDQERPYTLTVGRTTIELSMLDVLFGKESKDGDKEHLRGVLSFWDALPQVPGDSLAVDIMTPHQSHYYQQKNERKNGASITPHDSGQPTPISFLTLPPGTGFTFHVRCDQPRLERIASDLADNDRWQTLLTAAFEHAFAWLGFGAKTAVGYGAMEVDSEAAQARNEAKLKRQEEAEDAIRRGLMTPAMRTIDDFIIEFRSKHEQHPEFKERANAVFHGKARALAKMAHEASDWTAEEKHAAAEAIETWLPRLVQIDIKDERRKLKLNALKVL